MPCKDTRGAMKSRQNNIVVINVIRPFFVHVYGCARACVRACVCACVHFLQCVRVFHICNDIDAFVQT